jgi:hypothetical protein
MRCAALCHALLLAGCVGDLIDITPHGGSPDGGATDGSAGSSDGSGVNLMPKFFPDIQHDLDLLTCTSVSCHGAAQEPIYHPNPTAQADQDANYMVISIRAMAGANSLVLVKTTRPTCDVSPPSGIAPHGGACFFTGPTDPTYQKWLAWINAGNPKQ